MPPAVRTLTARTITDPAPQAKTLAQVAEMLARAGNARIASCIAAAVCAAGRWTDAVGPVLVLVPSAYPALAPMLEELQ